MWDRSEHLIVVLIVAMGLVALANTVCAQVKPPQAPPDDVVRVNTDLVQIDAAVWLAPGLYQLRVGVRDVRTGKSGSATEWIRVRPVN